MKRLRDENYVPLKRPFGASRGQSYGQAQSAGGGGGGQKLTTDDALQYLKEVKDMFQDQREKYDQFLEVMKDFKAQRIYTEGVIARVKDLFKGHNNLIYGFNTFLPKGYEITLDEDESLPKKVVEFEEAINFVNKIKKRFQNDDHVYKSFLEILNMYRREHKTISEVYEEVSQLFEEHPDLLDEFTRFLPDNSAAASSVHHAQQGRSTFHHYGDHSAVMPHAAMPTSRQLQLDKRWRRDRVSTSYEECDLSVNRPDLDEDKAMFQAHKDLRKREKESRDRRNRDSHDREVEHDSNRDFNNQCLPDKRKPARKEGIPLASCDDKIVLKSMYDQEFVFCESVKEKLGSSDDYQAFLKCLHIYSTEIITRSELQGLVFDLLSKYPDLKEGFNDFLERCENIDGFLTDVMSRKSLWNDGHLPRSMKVEEKDKEAKCDIEGAKEKKDKYWKSIQDLDLSDCQSCSPSYRLLPDDHPVPTASQRSEIGAQVLNDHWVSVTSGSEDYSFKHMRRNQYEESLFRCEDDRFELDMLLESVSSSAKRAEDLLNNINSNVFIMDASYRIEDHFTALNLRCIERLYGDHGLDVMDILRKNPAVALPVILTRLKQKQEEWTKWRSEFNKVWAEIYAKNHYKSLDHRSFYFKQQDSKNLSVKSLVAEIKEIKENMQKDDDVVLAVAAAYKRPLIPHLEFLYPDVFVHEDLRKLIKYSCEEICSSKEELNKVMKLWTTFLEPILGVPCQIHSAENAEDAVKAQHCSARHDTIGTMEIDGTSSAEASIVNSKQQEIVANGNENMMDATKSCHTTARDLDSLEHNTAHKYDLFSNALPGREVNDVGATDKVPERSISSNASSHAETEGTRARSNVGLTSGTRSSFLGPSNAAGDSHEPNPHVDAIQPKEDAVVSKPVSISNGILPEGSDINRHQEESAGHSKSEKEEGELSPNGDFEADNSVVLADAGVHPEPEPTSSAGCEPYQNGIVEDAVVENDADADDDDSENASEAAADASGSESAGEKCSREKHEEDEDVEKGELDGKVESESEADVHYNGGNGMALPQSEYLLASVKPLKKYVSSAVENAERKNSCVFYGNDNFYALFRLHQALYERILTAKISSTSSQAHWKNSKDMSSIDPYASFMSALFNLLDGSSDNAKFEDDCWAIIGNQAYVLFTLDKLIYKLVKQLETVATDEIDCKLLQLYEYEKSRKSVKFVDSVYHENARVLHDENIYRVECSSAPAQLLIRLMDSANEKPDTVAVSMEPNFSSYLHNDFLSLVPGKKETYGILLQRNKRKFAGHDENSATSMFMEDVQLFSGLECKIICRTKKIFYVLDTEDFFCRPSRKRRNLHADQRVKLDQTRVQRFHKFLSAS